MVWRSGRGNASGLWVTLAILGPLGGAVGMQLAPRPGLVTTGGPLTRRQARSWQRSRSSTRGTGSCRRGRAPGALSEPIEVADLGTMYFAVGLRQLCYQRYSEALTLAVSSGDAALPCVGAAPPR